MGPHMMHWEIIKHAKKEGYRYYDFRGANPKDENHFAYKESWKGISRFKSGFNGSIACYPQSFDLIYRGFWYRVYRLVQKLRAIIHI